MSENTPPNQIIEAGGEDSNPIAPTSSVRSLKELIERVSGKDLQTKGEREDAGIAEVLPFPFLALVGQSELKLALILALVNPSLGGVLLLGPRGTGKTTAVRSLVDLLPQIPRSLCFYGCLPEDIETGGVDAVCPDCARKFAEGKPLSKMDRVRLVELPLNARLEDVVGGIDERVAVHDRLRLKRGLLAQADKNILYVDEVNLLSDEVVDALLDAAAQGSYTVRRGAVSAVFRSRFVLIGSMNPEEGRLRPQIQDRFGLRVIVHGLKEPKERMEAYERVQAYLAKPRQMIGQYADETALVQAEIQQARDSLVNVSLSEEVAQIGLKLISQLNIDSLRAEITLFESARAHAAADRRDEVSIDDLIVVAPMALRLRRSSYITEYLDDQNAEEEELKTIIHQTIN
ncbi:MAG: ATP-binding protein [Anaerolineales bacterium]|nr:ATP-binding protein [Anaerolineales bacterium]